MAKSGNQKIKLLLLLKMLHDHTDAEVGLSMPEIIEKLAAQGIAAERKSVYRDIDTHPFRNLTNKK